MADKIGVLNTPQTAIVVGTHVAYTVPANKAARVKLFYRMQGAATTTLRIQVNGKDIISPAGLAIGANFVYSAHDRMCITPGVAPVGTTVATTCSVAPMEYYLSAGQTIQYIIGTADAVTMNLQVVGIEVDV